MADIWEGSKRDREHRQFEQDFRADGVGFGLDPQKVWAAGIRARYDDLAKQPLPNRFRDLLKRLDNVA